MRAPLQTAKNKQHQRQTCKTQTDASEPSSATRECLQDHMTAMIRNIEAADFTWFCNQKFIDELINQLPTRKPRTICDSGRPQSKSKMF